MTQDFFHRKRKERGKKLIMYRYGKNLPPNNKYVKFQITRMRKSSFSQLDLLPVRLSLLSAWVTKDEVKKPKGPPTRSCGPESPYTAIKIYSCNCFDKSNFILNQFHI